MATEQHHDAKPTPRTRSKGLIIFSRIASFIFHPFLMTAVTTFALYKLIPAIFPRSSAAMKIFISKLAMFTILFPFLSVFLFRKLQWISDARMHKPLDRIYPLLTSLIFYTLAYWLLMASQPIFIHSLLLGSCLSIFILLLVTRFYKVSVHTSAAAIPVGICIVLMLNGRLTVTPLIFALLIAIIVGIVRWLLGAHTIGQILLGYVTGIFTQLGAYYYLQQ